MPPTSSAPAPLSTRSSRLGLGLDLNPVNEVSASADSQLDPFSIWASNPDTPYSGWKKDIKDD